MFALTNLSPVVAFGRLEEPIFNGCQASFTHSGGPHHRCDPQGRPLSVAELHGLGMPGLTSRRSSEIEATCQAQLLNGTYRPQPVRRVELPKPDGGVRKLGIPTVLDRLIQQAILRVLQRRSDRTFLEHSYGFRPGRSAHQAVAQRNPMSPKATNGWSTST